MVNIFSRVLLGCTEIDFLLLRIIVFLPILLGFTWFSWIELGLIGFPLTGTQCNDVLMGCYWIFIAVFSESYRFWFVARGSAERETRDTNGGGRAVGAFITGRFLSARAGPGARRSGRSNRRRSAPIVHRHVGRKTKPAPPFGVSRRATRPARRRRAFCAPSRSEPKIKEKDKKKNEKRKRYVDRRKRFRTETKTSKWRRRLNLVNEKKNRTSPFPSSLTSRLGTKNVPQPMGRPEIGTNYNRQTSNSTCPPKNRIAIRKKKPRRQSKKKMANKKMAKGCRP